MSKSWNESYIGENIPIGGCGPYVMTREEIIQELLKEEKKRQAEQERKEIMNLADAILCEVNQMRVTLEKLYQKIEENMENIT